MSILTDFKYFKDAKGELYAFAIDGSQDDFISPDLTFVETDEIKNILVPPYNFEDDIVRIKGEVGGIYEGRMDLLSMKYPPSERATWPVQITEANALIVLGEKAETPFIDACLEGTDVSRIEYAHKIISNNLDWSKKSGQLLGVKQNHIHAIESIEKLPPAAAEAAAKSYDVNSGWPAIE